MNLKLNQKQKENLADFFRSISLIFLAGAIATLFGPADKINPFTIVLAAIIASGFIIFSSILLR